MHYPGGKSGCGVYQKLINLIPPHRVYIETHLGGGAILRKKKPAMRNIGVDIDKAVIESWNSEKRDKYKIIHADAMDFLCSWKFEGDEFIYVDPPYLKSTRRSQRRMYRFDYTFDDHRILLEKLREINCAIMISGYDSPLYRNILNSWELYQFSCKTQYGVARELVWMNYSRPNILHDYSYIGENANERQNIDRLVKRWVKNFEKMPLYTRQRVLSELQKVSLR